jgi:hypothetical protein
MEVVNIVVFGWLQQMRLLFCRRLQSFSGHHSIMGNSAAEQRFQFIHFYFHHLWNILKVLVSPAATVDRNLASL